MNNIGSVIYQTIARYAEGGVRVTRVELPPALYEEYATEPGLSQMYRTLKVEIVEKDGLTEPRFFSDDGGKK